MRNKKTTYSILGASNHSKKKRAKHDYYATPPLATRLLLEEVDFNPNILEPACGEGHISKVLEEAGFNVCSTDLIDRGFGVGEQDFLKRTEKFDGDIITNPPYIKAKEFVEQSLELIPEGNKVAMLLKLQFLESKGRKSFFQKYPPKDILVSSSRIRCGKNGDFGKTSGAIAYAWFIWEKGYTGKPRISWIN